MVQLSLCIATMNRWEFLKNYIPNYLVNPYISEIIISDETGEDAKKIEETYGKIDKLKVFVNEKSLGAFLNKQKAVQLASNDWVCLIDSDNYAKKNYFEAFHTFLNGHAPNPKIIYAPSVASNWNFKHFIGTPVTCKNVKEIYHKFVGGPLMNTGNYILHKSLAFLPIPEDQETYPVACKAFDVLYRNYLAMKTGVELHVVPNMEYEHVTHKGSYWCETALQIDQKMFEELLFSLSN
jgi:glycosyltransferase involved in cell wall biosynthesis